MASPPETWANYRPRRSNYAILGGLVGGVAAFVGSYLAIAIGAAIDTFGLQTAVRRYTYVVERSADSMQALEWVFFEAHHVGSYAAVTEGGTTRTSPIPVRETAAWDGWLLLVPIVALPVVGYLVASVAPTWNLRSGFEAGASIAVGYCLLVVLFVALPTVSGSLDGTTVTVGPNRLWAIVVAGIAYPVAFGGVGGAIAGRS